ncbi:hypothetical protein COOONC_17664 [Cooperia oncophora]
MIHPGDQIDMNTDLMDARTTSREVVYEKEQVTLSQYYHPSVHFGGDSDPLDLNTVNRQTDTGGVGERFTATRPKDQIDRYMNADPFDGSTTNRDYSGWYRRDNDAITRATATASTNGWFSIHLLHTDQQPARRPVYTYYDASAPPPPPPPPSQSGTFCARAVCTALTTSGRARQVGNQQALGPKSHGRPTRF